MTLTLCKKLSESLYLESSGSCWSQGTVTQSSCKMVQAKDEAQISIEGHGQTSKLTHWPQMQHGGGEGVTNWCSTEWNTFSPVFQSFLASLNSSYSFCPVLRKPEMTSFFFLNYSFKLWSSKTEDQCRQFRCDPAILSSVSICDPHCLSPESYFPLIKFRTFCLAGSVTGKLELFLQKKANWEMCLAYRWA